MLPQVGLSFLLLSSSIGVSNLFLSLPLLRSLCRAHAAVLNKHTSAAGLLKTGRKWNSNPLFFSSWHRSDLYAHKYKKKLVDGGKLEWTDGLNRFAMLLLRARTCNRTSDGGRSLDSGTCAVDDRAAARVNESVLKFPLRLDSAANVNKT